MSDVKLNIIKNMVTRSRVDGYISWHDCMTDNSFGCGCCSYGEDVKSGDEISKIDEYIKIYESSIQTLKLAKYLLEGK